MQIWQSCNFWGVQMTSQHGFYSFFEFSLDIWSRDSRDEHFPNQQCRQSVFDSRCVTIRVNSCVVKSSGRHTLLVEKFWATTSYPQHRGLEVAAIWICIKFENKALHTQKFSTSVLIFVFFPLTVTRIFHSKIPKLPENIGTFLRSEFRSKD